MNLQYRDETFGTLEFNLEDGYIRDDLDRDAIWEESGHDYQTQQHIYAEIAGQLFEDHPDVDSLIFRDRDFGIVVQLPDKGEWFYLEAGTYPAYVA